MEEQSVRIHLRAEKSSDDPTTNKTKIWLLAESGNSRHLTQRPWPENKL